MEKIIPWAIALMTAAAPPEKVAPTQTFPGWEETADERAARYIEIANAAVSVAFEERGLYGKSRSGRAKTAAAILAVAFHESAFAKDVDIGPCYRGKDKTSSLRVRCDSGRSACMMQINIGDGTTREGWTQADLFADRKKCFSAGLRGLRESVTKCTQHGAAGRFAMYAGGSCDAPRALKASAELAAYVDKWVYRFQIPPAE